MQRSTLLCLLSVVAVTTARILGVPVDVSIGVPQISDILSSGQLRIPKLQQPRNLDETIEQFEDLFDEIEDKIEDAIENSIDKTYRPPPGGRPPRPPPGGRPPHPPPGGHRPPPPGGHRPPPSGGRPTRPPRPTGSPSPSSSRPTRPPSGGSSGPPRPTGSPSPSSSRPTRPPVQTSIAPSSTSPRSNDGSRTRRASIPRIPGLPAIPDASELVPEILVPENSRPVVPPIRQVRAVGSNLVNATLEEARKRVSAALNVTGNFIDGLQTALQQAFESQNPTDAVRTVINTILNTYLTVALNCPAVTVGFRVVQEGIRLAGQVAESARNVVFGS